MTTDPKAQDIYNFVQTSILFSFYFEIYKKINSRIWFGPEN